MKAIGADTLPVGADTLPVGVVRVDEQGTITAANEWFAQWAGTSAEGLVGRAVSEFVVHAHDDLFPDGRGPGPWMMIDPRTPERAVLAARRSEADGDVLVFFEASERLDALAHLRRSYALADRTRTRLQLIMDSSVAFANASTEDELAEVLAATTARAYGAEASTVYLHKHDGTSVVAAGDDVLGGELDAETIIGLVSAPRRIVQLVDRSDAERLLPGLGERMRDAGIHALIAAPLHHEESDFGAFVAWFRHTRTFDSEAAPLAEALMGQAAQALATLRLQERLSHAAMHDEVTGLPNRRMLESQLEELSGSTGCAVLFVDLDEFKAVNDRFGHHTGDRVLGEVAKRLLSGVRTDDVVARYGGDEFVVVACDVADVSAATDIAARLLDALHGDETDPRSRRFSASIGIVLAPPGSTYSVDVLIRRADRAMYRAKAEGGDRAVMADD